MSPQEIENSEKKILKQPVNPAKKDLKKYTSQQFDHAFPEMEAPDNKDFPNEDVALQEENVK